MTDLERLIELLDNAPADPAGNRNVRTLAEYLLANGVIVPPCKVGDTVYIIDDGDEGAEPYVLDVLVTVIGYDIGGFWITVSLPLGMKMSAHIGERSFGKTVFLTREEAEKGR